jgi:tetratricopeptide (TPR) repeat protein
MKHDPCNAKNFTCAIRKSVTLLPLNVAYGASPPPYADGPRHPEFHPNAGQRATQLERLGEPNPFDWIHAAQQAHSEGQYTEAISLYKKAVAIAPYLHESYFGMARSHYELGNRERAETELAQALERADRASTRSLYEAKLAALTGSPIEE